MWARVKVWCAPYQRYLVDGLVVLLLVLGYRMVQTYRHFEWQNVTNGQGVTFAVPSFRK